MAWASRKKLLAGAGTGGHAWKHCLDGDQTLQLWVLRLVDDTHAAGAEDGQDAVGPKATDLVGALRRCQEIGQFGRMVPGGLIASAAERIVAGGLVQTVRGSAGGQGHLFGICSGPESAFGVIRGSWAGSAGDLSGFGQGRRHGPTGRRDSNRRPQPGHLPFLPANASLTLIDVAQPWHLKEIMLRTPETVTGNTKALAEMAPFVTAIMKVESTPMKEQLQQFRRARFDARGHIKAQHAPGRARDSPRTPRSCLLFHLPESRCTGLHLPKWLVRLSAPEPFNRHLAAVTYLHFQLVTAEAACRPADRQLLRPPEFGALSRPRSLCPHTPGKHMCCHRPG